MPACPTIFLSCLFLAHFSMGQTLDDMELLHRKKSNAGPLVDDDEEARKTEAEVNKPIFFVGFPWILHNVYE